MKSRKLGRLATDGREPKLLPGRNINSDGKRRVARVANVMLSREAFQGGAVGAGVVVTTEGVSRLECRNVCTVVFVRPFQSLSGVSHPKEISVPTITISTNSRISKGEVRKTSWANQVLRAIRLRPRSACRLPVR